MLKRTSIVTVVTANANQAYPLLSINEKRTHLKVNTGLSNAGGLVTILLSPFNTVAANAPTQAMLPILLGSSNPPFELDIETHGDIVQQALWVSTQSAGALITAIETIEDEDG